MERQSVIASSSDHSPQLLRSCSCIAAPACVCIWFVNTKRRQDLFLAFNFCFITYEPKWAYSSRLKGRKSRQLMDGGQRAFAGVVCTFSGRRASQKERVCLWCSTTVNATACTTSFPLYFAWPGGSNTRHASPNLWWGFSYKTTFPTKQLLASVAQATQQRIASENCNNWSADRQK